MATVQQTLVQCCCACDCQQFAAIHIVWSFANDVTTTDSEDGVSSWSATISEEIDLVIDYDPEATPASGKIIHDPEEAPEVCAYASGTPDPAQVILENAPFTYPDPDELPGLGENSVDKTGFADLMLGVVDVNVDCEGNGTLGLYWSLEGGDAAEILDSQTGTGFEFAPFEDGVISVPLVAWQGEATLTYAPEIDPEVGFGTSGLSEISVTVEFLLEAP